jgi:hypothetical protein
MIESSPLQAHNHTWCLQFYPRVDNQSTIDDNDVDSMLSLFLLHKDPKRIRAQVVFQLDIESCVYNVAPMRLINLNDSVGVKKLCSHVGPFSLIFCKNVRRA